MPSTSPKQHRFMEAIAHSPSFAKQAGVSQSVGKDFAKADDAAGITKNPSGSPKTRSDHIASRSRQGLSQKSIGKEFGMHQSSISRSLRKGYLSNGSAKG